MATQVQSQLIFLILWIGLMVAIKGADAYAWTRPGCHRLGHTRRVTINGCVEFEMTTNACRGYCTSFAIPSTEDSLLFNRHQVITSIGECCNIMETEDVVARVMCRDGPRTIVFKSAKSCGCFHCKKE
ncbi:thyrostimulin alpha-2 subunit [Tetranychus urticae]|uniref:thyrostimulin alpha-2 subunit n=1 Tax=Tetranychus urticae TaxID=32264 RepID=UPI00077BE96B|nr:thyrostimulin alpha-2 subunit [Tetranychus urticae]